MNISTPQRRVWLQWASALAMTPLVASRGAQAAPSPAAADQNTTTATVTPAPTVQQPGHLVIVGGAEDRRQDRLVLNRFVELCGGPQARVLVCTAASVDPEAAWAGYQPVFAELGVANCQHLSLRSPEEASDPAVVDLIEQADGVFISGGDQRRLMATLWETPAAQALHRAYHLRGRSLGGTSAGAAAMSRHMLAIGEATPRPERDAVSMDIGLGLMPWAVVDQHFSERGRLGRLLSALAQRPDLLGVGIDEDTALVVHPDHGIEVVGAGNVTLVDGRHMDTNFRDLGPAERVQMLGVQLHLLPSGCRYGAGAPADGPIPPAPLRDVVALLVQRGPIRG